MSIERPAYDERGRRWCRCSACGMGWFESREPVDLLGGGLAVTIAGEREHTCPEPWPYERARAFAAAARAAGGVVVDPLTAAAVLLGLKRGPDA